MRLGDHGAVEDKENALHASGQRRPGPAFELGPVAFEGGVRHHAARGRPRVDGRKNFEAELVRRGEKAVGRGTVAAAGENLIALGDREILPARQLVEESVRLVEESGGENAGLHESDTTHAIRPNFEQEDREAREESSRPSRSSGSTRAPGCAWDIANILFV